MSTTNFVLFFLFKNVNGFPKQSWKIVHFLGRHRSKIVTNSLYLENILYISEMLLFLCDKTFPFLLFSCPRKQTIKRPCVSVKTRLEITSPRLSLFPLIPLTFQQFSINLISLATVLYLEPWLQLWFSMSLVYWSPDASTEKIARR